MLRFERANERWWNKPLVRFSGRVLPAELAVLATEKGATEDGAWLNSRGTRTGVVDLLDAGSRRYKTKRIHLPAFVSKLIASLYQAAGVSKGAPDLVLWSAATGTLRFAEVKCPHSDELTQEQLIFMDTARSRGISTTICEWEFRSASSRRGT